MGEKGFTASESEHMASIWDGLFQYFRKYSTTGILIDISRVNRECSGKIEKKKKSVRGKSVGHKMPC